jgi:ATP-dependent RNA helicase DDX41
VEYTRSLATGWKAPLKVRRLSEDDAQGIRDRFHIIVEGEHLPAPIIDFADMKLPPAVRAGAPTAPARRPCRPGPRRQGGRKGGRHVA